MKPLLPVLAAGGTFAAGAVLGLFVGVMAASHSGQALWGPAGLLIGATIGGYSAIRLIMRSIQ